MNIPAAGFESIFYKRVRNTQKFEELLGIWTL